MDKSAAEQASANFTESPWNDRLSIAHETIQSFSQRIKHQKQYDCIISNPPFFSDSQKSTCPRRAAARHLDSLSFSELLNCIDLLMTDNGHCQIILPVAEGNTLCRLAHESKLVCTSFVRLHPLPQQPAHRLIMTLQRKNQNFQASTVTDLSIRIEANTYSPEFDQLLKPYYLRYQ